MESRAWFLFRQCTHRLVPTLRVETHTRTLRVRVPPMHGQNKNQARSRCHKRIRLKASCDHSLHQENFNPIPFPTNRLCRFQPSKNCDLYGNSLKSSHKGTKTQSDDSATLVSLCLCVRVNGDPRTNRTGRKFSSLTSILFWSIWKKLDNPNFNALEFEGFRKKAGLNRRL